MLSKRQRNTIQAYFLESEETIAVAESVTSGLLQFLLSNVTDAANFYQGGITTYNIGQKSKHLDVEPIHANNCNCVSLKVTEQMATNVCELFHSDWGIGVTGYASPVPEAENKLFCYYAICYQGAIIASGKVESKKDLPETVQKFYGKTIINELINSTTKRLMH
jgi:nicotinamide-nucleotide amidase